MKRKGFTLIELLAVIIILGILLLIAIPGVTSYINNSRKNVYVDTAKELVKGTSKLLNSGDFDTLDEDVTYYMDSRCIANESGKEAQSPFGKFDPAYVLIVNENDTYNYYFQSRDETEVGVKDITKMDDLQISKIVSNVKEEDIDTSVGIGKTTKTAIIDQNCNVGEAQPATRRVSMNGESMITLTFDNQGGTGCDMQSQYYGEEWGKLCKPKKEGLKFVGWYTKTNSLGDKITKTTKAEKSMTVYAAWTDEYATFDIGTQFAGKIKELSGSGNYLYGSENRTIKNIVHSDVEPDDSNKQQENIVSAQDSGLPIYAWFDSNDGIIYWWSIDENPYLNSDCSYMFSAFYELTDFDSLIDFDTSKVTDMDSMFSHLMKNINLDFSEFDTSSVTTMLYMFAGSKRIQNLDLSSFNTSKVTDMYGMFWDCQGLKNVDISSFDTSNARVEWMFIGCVSIRSLDLTHFDISNSPDLTGMFEECLSLRTLNISTWDTSNVTSFRRLFKDCNYLEAIDLSNFNTSKLTNIEEMFSGCLRIFEIDLSYLNISNVTKVGGLFAGCYNLVSVDLSGWDTSNIEYLGYSGGNGHGGLGVGMFYECSKLTSVNFSGWNTQNVKYMGNMFKRCKKLETIDLSNFDTSNVTSMSSLFEECINLKTVYVSDKFVTNNVIYDSNIFSGCTSLVGGANTLFDSTMASDITKAQIDGGESNPGLFTLKI